MRYLDIQLLGPELGVQDYFRGFRERHGTLIDDTGYCYVYGDDPDELASEVQRRKDRIDFANDFPGEHTHLDGMLMSRREILIHVLRDARPGERHAPRFVVGAEIYPPFMDPAVQAAEEASLHAEIDKAYWRDHGKIAERLSNLDYMHWLF